MSERDRHETLWEQIPEGLEPPDFPRRRAFLLSHVGAGQRVLDLGCGEGHFAQALLAAGATVTAADVASVPLRRAQRRVAGLAVCLLPCAPPWPLPEAAFDAVWAGEVAEHVNDTSAWLSETRRVLRSGGRLLMSTPDHGPLSSAAMALRPHLFDRHFDPRSEHLRFYTRRTLRALLDDFAFEAIAIRAMGGVPGARRTLLASARRMRF